MNFVDVEVKKSKEELIKTRREFHSHPESGWYTFYTTCKIISELKKYSYTLKLGEEIVDSNLRQGIGTKEELENALVRAKKLLTNDEAAYLKYLKDGLTGVVAEIDTNKEGPVVAFRIDIDAVDVGENKTQKHRPTVEGFASDAENIMHACGHDGHIAIGLLLAKIVSQNIDKFKGKIRFIFQTGEEGCRGAMGMKVENFLKDVDYLFGGHIGFQAKKNKSIICGINNFLATSKFDVSFDGKSAHASGAPQDGANALLAAAQAANAMYAITRNAQGVTRVNVGVLNAGKGRNVIPPNAYMACETRGETTSLNEFMKDKCEKIIKGMSIANDVAYKIKPVGGTAGGNSSCEITKEFKKAALESPFVDNDLITDNYDFGACEDYAYFMRYVQENGAKSGYAMFGTKLASGHHNELFDFDEEVLSQALDVYLRVLLNISSK